MVIFMAIAFFFSGCASIMTSATRRMADNLSSAILNNDDPATVAE